MLEVRQSVPTHISINTESRNRVHNRPLQFCDAEQAHITQVIYYESDKTGIWKTSLNQMAQFSLATKLVLFLTSYIPLFLIISMNISPINPIYSSPPLYREYSIIITWPVVLTIFISILLMVLLSILMKYHSRLGNTTKKYVRSQQKNELLSYYLLVYVFVFAGLNFSDPVDWLILLIFLIMLLILQIKSEMLHVNPMLGLIGYDIYEVKGEYRNFLVISKEDIEKFVEIPESKKGDEDTTHRQIRVVSLGSESYLTPQSNDESDG